MDQPTDICREKAVECKRMATLVTYETIRSVYLELEKQWLHMAEDRKALERRISHFPRIVLSSYAPQARD
jgi:hypothetical protein